MELTMAAERDCYSEELGGIVIIQNCTTTKGRFLELYKASFNKPELREINEGKESLPAFIHRDEIKEALGSKQVSIICGATGSGKSSQSPILEGVRLAEGGNPNSPMERIIVACPNSLSVPGLAKRVAEEFGTKVGEAVGWATGEGNRCIVPETSYS